MKLLDDYRLSIITVMNAKSQAIKTHPLAIHLHPDTRRLVLSFDRHDKSPILAAILCGNFSHLSQLTSTLLSRTICFLVSCLLAPACEHQDITLAFVTYGFTTDRLTIKDIEQESIGL